VPDVSNLILAGDVMNYWGTCISSTMVGSFMLILAAVFGDAGVPAPVVYPLGALGVATILIVPLMALVHKVVHTSRRLQTQKNLEVAANDATRKRQRYQTIEDLHDARYPRALRPIRDAAWRTAFDWRDMTDHMPSQVVVRGDHALRVLVDAANETCHGLKMDLLGRPVNSDGALEDSLERVTRQVIALLQSDIDQVRANFHEKALSSTHTLSWQLDRYALPTDAEAAASVSRVLQQQGANPRP
jgi:hypothetical protein